MRCFQLQLSSNGVPLLNSTSSSSSPFFSSQPLNTTPFHPIPTNQLFSVSKTPSPTPPEFSLHGALPPATVPGMVFTVIQTPASLLSTSPVPEMVTGVLTRVLILVCFRFMDLELGDAVWVLRVLCLESFHL
jgi:hypothetical protein